MKKVFKYFGHDDHGISKQQIDFIQKHPELLKIEDGKFIRKIIKIPKGLGNTYSALYGPYAGDIPIKESEVFYAKRGNRKGKTRFIKAPLRQVNYLCVLGIKAGSCFTIFGTQSETPPPMEPWDRKFKGLSEKEQKRVVRFWKEHALVYEE